MPDPKPCIFCAILAGEAPASIVYRDDQVTALMDLYPVTPGHTLVIPNQHAVGLSDLPADDGQAMFRVAHRVSHGLKASGIPCDGINLFLADGAVAFQTVFHVHLHVLPRVKGDGFGLKFPAGYPTEAARDDLEAAAARLRAALPPAG